MTYQADGESTREVRKLREDPGVIDGPRFYNLGWRTRMDLVGMSGITVSILGHIADRNGQLVLGQLCSSPELFILL